MARISGLARSTIYHGLSDIRHKVSAPSGRIRKEGGGRKKKAIEDPQDRAAGFALKGHRLVRVTAGGNSERDEAE